MTDERAKEVVDHLRASAMTERWAPYHSQAMADAADELERLRAVVKPFADLWETLHPATRGYFQIRVNVAPGDLKRAAEVLK